MTPAPEASKPANFQKPAPPENSQELKKIEDKLQKGETITDYKSFEKALEDQHRDIAKKYSEYKKELQKQFPEEESEGYKKGIQILGEWIRESMAKLEELKNLNKKLEEEHCKRIQQVHEETLRKARDAANPEIFKKFYFPKEGVWYSIDSVMDLKKKPLGIEEKYDEKYVRGKYRKKEIEQWVMKHGEHIYKKALYWDKKEERTKMLIERYEPEGEGYDTWISYSGLDHADQSLTKAIAAKPVGKWTEIPEDQGGEKETQYLYYNGDFYAKKEDRTIAIYVPDSGTWMAVKSDGKWGGAEMHQELTQGLTMIDSATSKIGETKDDKWLDGETQVAQGEKDREYRMIHGTLFSKKKDDSQTSTIESYDASSRKWYSWGYADFQKFQSIEKENIWTPEKEVVNGNQEFEYMRSNGKLYARTAGTNGKRLMVYTPGHIIKSLLFKDIVINGIWTSVMKYTETNKPFFENIKQDGIWIKGDTIGAKETHKDYLRLGNAVYARWRSRNGYYAYEAASITDVQVTNPSGNKLPQLNFTRIYTLPFVNDPEAPNNVEQEQQRLNEEQEKLETNKQTADEKIQAGKSLADQVEQMLQRLEILFSEKNIQEYINTDSNLTGMTADQIIKAIQFFRTATTDIQPSDDQFFESLIKEAESHSEILNKFHQGISVGIAAMEQQEKENPAKSETNNLYSQYLKKENGASDYTADFESNRDAEMRTTLGDLFPGQEALWVTDARGHKGLAIKVGTEFFYENGRRAIVLNGYKIEIPATDEDQKKITEMKKAFEEKTTRKQDVSKGFEHKCLRAARLVERYAKTIQDILENPDKNLKPKQVEEYEKTLQEADTEMRKEMERAERRANEAKSERAKTAAEKAKKRIGEIDALPKDKFNAWAEKAKQPPSPETPPGTDTPPKTASADEPAPTSLE